LPPRRLWALLLGLFFMAVGMSTNADVLLDLPLQVALGVTLLIAIKFVVLAVTGRVFKLNTAQSLRFAGYLCQGGEFAFVLFTLAGSLGIIGSEQKDMLILIVTLSMALTPLVLALVARCVSRHAVEDNELTSMLPTEEAQAILIAGFGRFGQILGRVLNARGIRYTAIDRNSEQVQLMRRFGNQVYFGDVTRHQLLENAHAGAARVLGGLGVDAAAIERSISTFQQHDQLLVEQQAALVDERDSMIQSVRQAADELKLLLQQESTTTALSSAQD
jgi:CPA2 family monovalent cation:H+ antiporter-2